MNDKRKSWDNVEEKPCQYCGELFKNVGSHERNCKKKPVEENVNATEVAEKVTEKPQPKSGLTPEERAVFERVAGEKDDWKTITEADVVDFSLSVDPFLLPPEALKKQDAREFRFRWAEMKSQRIDLLRTLPVPMRWWVCNSVQTPFLKHLCDPIHGGIQRLDQILMFKPYWMFEKHQAAKQDIAENKDQAGDISKRNGLKQDGVEWKSGEQFGITSKDEVMDFDGVLDEAQNEESVEE